MQRCLCGFTAFLEKTVGGYTRIQAHTRSADVTIPRAGTKIHTCLMVTRGAWPNPLNTTQVAEYAKLQKPETSSLLMVLMGQGLIVRVEKRKGMVGGSTWSLSPAAEKYFNVQGE